MDELNRDPLCDRRVLVTGHTGFKGSWLTIWLRILGAKVGGFALNPPTNPSMFDMVGAGSGILDRRGEIGEASAVRKVVEQFEPEVVFHLAAQAVLREGYRDPLETYATNVMGVANLLNACRFAPSVKAIVVVSSDKCYENRNWPWGYRENDRLGGFDPYSSSKACAELISDSFRRSYFDEDSRRVGLATARAGNVIGGGDWARDRLIPDLARAAISRERSMIRNPSAIRPWQHVLEPLSGYLQLARCLLADARQFSGSWNFGPSPNSTQTVGAVVERVAACWKDELDWCTDDRKHPHEAPRLILDSTKAANELGWRPRLTFAETIAMTADWYRAARRDESDLRRLTEEQIASYAAKASPC